MSFERRFLETNGDAAAAPPISQKSSFLREAPQFEVTMNARWPLRSEMTDPLELQISICVGRSINFAVSRSARVI
jgi:hypothetical protein